MKKQLLLALALMMGFMPVKAQDEKKEEGFQFTTIKKFQSRPFATNIALPLAGPIPALP